MAPQSTHDEPHEKTSPSCGFPLSVTWMAQSGLDVGKEEGHILAVLSTMWNTLIVKAAQADSGSETTTPSLAVM